MSIDIDTLIAYETGELNPRAELEFIGTLIESGVVWSLQGSYGRYADSLIDEGILTDTGALTEHALGVLEDAGL